VTSGGASTVPGLVASIVVLLGVLLLVAAVVVVLVTVLQRRRRDRGLAERAGTVDPMARTVDRSSRPAQAQARRRLVLP
jgi:Flp pilus assembly protein TadB